MKLLGFEIRRATGEANVESAINSYLIDQDGNGRSSILINKDSALSLSAVWRCVSLISETVASLPLHLYQKKESGEREQQGSHPAIRVINRPTGFQGRYDLLFHLVINCLLTGNGYARIIRDKKTERPKNIILLDSIEPILSADGLKLRYRLSNGEVLEADEVLHLRGVTSNGVKGLSPITVHRGNLGLAVDAQDYGQRFFRNGGNSSGIFTHPGSLSDEAYKRLKTGLHAKYVGLENSHSPLLLEGGLKYERVSIPPDDAQFIETRKFQATEIARIYGVPPHMIADLDRATNNNIEQQSIEFVLYCLMPYLSKLESEFRRKLLWTAESDEKGFYFKFEVNGLMRGDSKSRSEYYKSMYMISAMSPNSILDLEDMNGYEGGDSYFMQRNMMRVDDIDKEEVENNGKRNEKPGGGTQGEE